MENLQCKRIYFDAEDRPPPSYWLSKAQELNDESLRISQDNGNSFSSTQIRTTIKPEGQFIID